MRKHLVWNFDKEFLQNCYNESNSYIELFDKLNLEKSKSLIKMLDYRVKKDNIDKSLFKKNIAIQRKKHLFKEIEIEKILVENSTYLNTRDLKKRLLSLNLIIYECKICKIDSWQNKNLTLQLDHINGKSNDNRLENLRLLCPNCHSQTDTYAGKKKKEISKLKKLEKCHKCKCDVINKVFCDECDKLIKMQFRKVERPSKDYLLQLVNEIGYSATGRKYGVSDNAIRKWIK